MSGIDESEEAKPRIIDLTAADVEVDDTPKDEPPPAYEAWAAKPANSGDIARNWARNWARKWLWPAGALVAGSLIGVWLYRSALSDYFPSNALLQAQAEIAQLQQQAKSNSDRLQALLDQSGAAIAAVKKFEADQSDATTRLSIVESSIAALDAKMLKLQSQPTATSATTSAAFANLQQKLSDIEKQLETLKAEPPHPNRAILAASLIQSFSDLKAKADAGQPYQRELDPFAHILPAAAGLSVLKAYAATGVPNGLGLATELREQTLSLPKAATSSDEDNGYISSLSSVFGSLVTVRRVGEVDWQSLAGQAADLSAAGDLQAAAQVLDKADGPQPPLLHDWRVRLQHRVELEAALAAATASVTNQLAAFSAQPASIVAPQ